MTILRKVRAGQRLRIQSDFVNQTIDMLNNRRNQRPSTQNVPSIYDTEKSYDDVIVTNVGSTPLNPFDVAAVDGVIVTPTDDLDEFKFYYGLNVKEPSVPGDEGNFVVALDGMEPGESAPAAISGLVPCRLNVQDESHTFADVADGVVTSLLTATEGNADIVWKEAGTGVKYGLVRLNRHPAAGGVQYAPEAVMIWPPAPLLIGDSDQGVWKNIADQFVEWNSTNPLDWLVTNADGTFQFPNANDPGFPDVHIEWSGNWQVFSSMSPQPDVGGYEVAIDFGEDRTGLAIPDDPTGGGNYSTLMDFLRDADFPRPITENQSGHFLFSPDPPPTTYSIFGRVQEVSNPNRNSWQVNIEHFWAIISLASTFDRTNRPW